MHASSQGAPVRSAPDPDRCPAAPRESQSKRPFLLHGARVSHIGRRTALPAHPLADGQRLTARRGWGFAVKGRPPLYTPRSTLNSRNSFTGSGVDSRQTMLIGLSPSADSRITGPQAR